MLDWLNTNMGTDWATYQGWGMAIVSLIIGVYAVFHAVPTITHVFNSTTNNNFSDKDDNADKLEKMNAHDMRIIEEILMLLPYDETYNWVEQSYINGIPLSVTNNLDKAQVFLGENYQLYNKVVNAEKNSFIESINTFMDSTMPFLHVDYPNREPIMVNLPHDWKYKGEEAEKNFRMHQNKMRETSGFMINSYASFVKSFKNEGFVIEKFN
ncbi:hypothetical protein [Rouxiella silvae]|uniref:hypothetical protein n=1 Tax=Rouxiella silvae TaxID=1646373 RepID=UPI0039EF04C4